MAGTNVSIFLPIPLYLWSGGGKEAGHSLLPNHTTTQGWGIVFCCHRRDPNVGKNITKVLLE